MRTCRVWQLHRQVHGETRWWRALSEWEQQSPVNGGLQSQSSRDDVHFRRDGPLAPRDGQRAVTVLTKRNIGDITIIAQLYVHDLKTWWCVTKESWFILP